MGRKKRPAPSHHNNPTATNGTHSHPHTVSQPHPHVPPAKKVATEQESYAVKKYRITSSHSLKAIDAFQKYTKTHRMSDATFTRVQPPGRGATISAPIVFSIRMGGSDLSWGRGKTRDAAIDNACRAAFGLVAAHGYHQFDLNEDCLAVEPMDVLNAALPPPPPPPPTLYGTVGAIGSMNTIGAVGYHHHPPPPGLSMAVGLPPPPGSAVPLPPGVPHLPPMAVPGSAPPLPPGGPPPSASIMMDLIPQPKLQDSTLVPSSHVSTTAGEVNLSLKPNATTGATTTTTTTTGSGGTGGTSGTGTRMKLKGGLTLVFQGETEHGGVWSMEEWRAKHARYRGALEKALALRTIALA